MRHPERGRNISVAVTLASVALITVPLLLPKGTLSVGVSSGMVACGLTVGLLALILSLQLHFNTKRYNKLIAGEGLLAQWMVTPDDWRKFMAYHVELAKLNPQYRNHLKLTAKPSVEGVEVILGERAIIVDGDYQEIPTVNNDSRFDGLELIVGPPMFINMHITAVYHTKSGSRRTYYALRFPVTAEAHADAAAAVTFYVERANALAVKSRSLASRYPGAVRNIALVTAILAGIACVIGFYSRNQPQMLNQDLALVLAVVGVLVTPAALIMTVIAHVILSRQRKVKANLDT